MRLPGLIHTHSATGRNKWSWIWSHNSCWQPYFHNNKIWLFLFLEEKYLSVILFRRKKKKIYRQIKVGDLPAESIIVNSTSYINYSISVLHLRSKLLDVDKKKTIVKEPTIDTATSSQASSTISLKNTMGKTPLYG